MPVKEPKDAIPWIQAAKLVKILTILLVCSMVVNIGLGGALTTLFPLKTTETVFVQVKNEGENFIILHKANEAIQNSMPLVGMFMRIYVNGREKVDKTTEKIRYPQIKAMSNHEVGNNFEKMVMDKKVSPFLRPFLKRDIQIVRDVALAKGIHQVIFDRIDTYDDKPSRKPKKTRWAATIHYNFQDQKVAFNQTHLNPVGLFVQEYTLTPTE